MDLSRFQALYAAETHEQLERLTGALLELDGGDVAHGAAEAFRAMHTLKSVAATMGHDAVAQLAHELEDALSTLRGRDTVEATTVDALLHGTDELRAAVTASLTAPVAEGEASAGSAPAPAARQVRVEEDRLGELADAVSEMAVLQARLNALAAAAEPAVAGLLEQMNRVVAELHVEMLALRMVPMAEVFGGMPRQVRDLARQLDKQVELRLEGGELRIDRAILEGLHEPLLHLVRNAVDHGLEPAVERAAAGKPPTGMLMLRAERDRAGIRIEVEDDGRGVAPQPGTAPAAASGLDASDGVADAMLRVISRPGYTTARQVTDVSGRGVGLDAVATKLRALGGALSMRTTPGAGTTFVLRVPTSRALTQALRVSVGDEDYVIPLTHVAEAIEFAAGSPVQVGSGEVVHVRGEAVRVVRLSAVLGTGTGGGERAAVLAEVGARRAALAVDELIGREQVLVKPFDVARGTLPLFSGATLLADGHAALVLDPASLV
jgi:two-component system, chemotaxis family, sensor kinase CheA